MLFPFSVLMAVPDGEAAADTGPSLGERVMAFAGHGDAKHISADVQDAAAIEDDAADADQQGNPGEDAADSDGLDTASDEEGDGADHDEDEEADADESDQKEDEDKEQKGVKKKSFSERVAEVAQKEVERILAEQAKATASEAPDFAEDEVVNKVKRNIVKSLAKIRELESEIDLEGDDADPKTVDELLELHKFVDGARKALADNEAKKAAWEKRQGEKKAQTDNGDVMRQELDKAADLYREEMKIDPGTWDKMGKWFEDQISKSKLLVEEFNDIFTRKGKVAAIRFAHEYTVANMGKETKEANQKKETTKTKAAALAPTTTGGKGVNEGLKKARAAYEANPSPETFAALKAQQRQARGAA